MFWNHAIADLDFISEIWADARDIDAATLERVLNAAHDQAIAYAPSHDEDAQVPDSWRIAEVLLARHVWSTMQGGNDSSIGPDGYPISTSTWNLVLQARDLLRPKSSPLGRIR